MSGRSNQGFSELRALLGDRFVEREALLRTYRSDFGRIAEGRPRAAAIPTSDEEVRRVVQICAEAGVGLVARGNAHSQSGQAVRAGGVVLDMTGLNRVLEVDDARGTVTCDGGASWQQVVDETLARGWIPPVLTNNLDATVAGTLSTAGLGVTSFREGTQADHVERLEVVTGTGELRSCSRSENPELFDAVRAGLGQFGVIARATLRLRRTDPRIRKYFLLYDDLATLLGDIDELLGDPDRFRAMEAWCSPCVQGTHRIGPGMNLGEGHQVFAAWFFPLHLSIEYTDDPPDTDTMIEGLHPYRLMHVEDYSQLEFAARLTPVFQLWHRSGYWDMAHPWMETILPLETAGNVIGTVLDRLPPQALGPGGHILLWPARRDASEVPNFMTPSAERLVGWGILPGVPPERLDEALHQMALVRNLAEGAGGKHYPSGYTGWTTPEAWRGHFGTRWPALCDAKERFDPAHILQPDIFAGDEPAPA